MVDCEQRFELQRPPRKVFVFDVVPSSAVYEALHFFAELEIMSAYQ